MLWVVHAETLITKGSLLPNKDYRFWPLRGTREDAWTRTVAFYLKKNKPPFENVIFEIANSALSAAVYTLPEFRCK